MPKEKYFIDDDNKGNWFLIPDSKFIDWHKWLCEGSSPPDYARPIEYPNVVIISEFEVEET